MFVSLIDRISSRSRAPQDEDGRWKLEVTVVEAAVSAADPYLASSICDLLVRL